METHLAFAAFPAFSNLRFIESACQCSETFSSDESKTDEKNIRTGLNMQMWLKCSWQNKTHFLSSNLTFLMNDSL